MIGTVKLSELTRFLSALAMAAGLVFALWPGTSAAAALVAGTAVGLLGLNAWTGITRPGSTVLLQASVIGLGAGINLAVIWSVGVGSIGYTLAGIAFVFALGLSLGRYARLSRDLTLLLASGTAICGGSAIAAVACVLKPREEETTVALATVFLLNALALVVFPLVGHAAALDQHAFGLWAALAIHDTSSVVGAGASYGEQALKVATTVKLARALWIAPLAFFIGWKFAGSRASGIGLGRRIAIPWFILGFVAIAAVVTWVPAWAGAGALLAAGAQRVLVATLFLIGANLSRGALALVGWRPLAVGTVLWLSVSLVTLAAILMGWIR